MSLTDIEQIAAECGAVIGYTGPGGELAEAAFSRKGLYEFASRLATPQPPKPAGGVPLPEPTFKDIGGRDLFDADAVRAYDDAREAAGRADAVPASVDEALRRAPSALAAFNAALVPSLRLPETITMRLAMADALLAGAPAPQQPTAEGERSAFQMVEEQELAAVNQQMTTQGEGAELLHPATADLVRRFSGALAEKLAAAEAKYGYSDGWSDPGWMDECRKQLIHHVRKGDPRDVAAYCAFLWHHGSHTDPNLPFCELCGSWERCECSTEPAGREAVACIDERHLQLLRQNWSQGNTLRHPKDAGEGDVLLYTHPSPVADAEALPRPLKDLLHFTEHCISAAEEGVDYAASREWLDAMTTMGIMEKVGRGKWAPTDHAEAVARFLTGSQP